VLDLVEPCEHGRAHVGQDEPVGRQFACVLEQGAASCSRQVARLGRITRRPGSRTACIIDLAHTCDRSHALQGSPVTTQPPKDRAPSIRDVARLADVSYQTVSRVLNDHPSIREATKARVTQVMEEIHYRPNRAARMLVTRHSRTIGVLSASSAQYGPASAIAAIEDAARKAGYYVNIANLAAVDPESISNALEHLLDQAIEGLVVIAPQVRVFDVLDEMSIDVPYVSLQSTVHAEHRALPVDQIAGARMATRHLVELGHREILHLAGPQDWIEAEARMRGFLREIDSALARITVRGDRYPSHLAARTGR